ncbi:MAG: hypothetical protein V1493_01255 [Candidatus Diapherotrites archaeon]
MERLEKITDIFSIIRDLLIIILIVVIIMLGFTIMNFINSINPKNISCENMVNTVISGDLSPIIGDADSGTGQPAQYTPTQEMLGLMNEIEKAAGTGDKQAALAKIGQLKEICSSAGMPDAVLKLDEFKAAVEQENYVQAMAAGSQLKKMFGQ